MDRFILIGGLFVCFVLISLGVVSAQQVIEIDSCGVLNISGATYVLTQDVAAGDLYISGSCFEISADGVTLDGGGHLVTGESNSEGYGVYSFDNAGVNVKNLRTENFYRGIYFVDVTDSVIEGNVVRSADIGEGVFLFSGSGNTISGNTMILDGDGIFLHGSSNNIIVNNTINQSIVWGIVMMPGSNDNIVSGNFIGSSGSTGLNVLSGEGNHFEDNYVVNAGGVGAVLSGGGNNGLFGNTFSSNSLGGILVEVSNDNVFDGEVLELNEGNGITLSGSVGNIFRSISVDSFSQDFDLFVSGGGVLNTQLVDSEVARYDLDLGGTFVFGVTGFGEIEFLDPISGSGESLSDDVQIGFNSVMVDSNSNPGLNSRARVSLFGNPGEGFDNPVILRDGVECDSSVCTALTSLDEEIVSFEVESWDGSEYSIGEGGEVVCGDSDGGLVPTVFGVACIGGVCEEDFCSGKYELREYTCRSESVISSRTYACANECNAGACKVERRRSFQILSRLSAKELVFPFFAVYHGGGSFLGLVLLPFISFSSAREDVFFSSNVTG